MDERSDRQVDPPSLLFLWLLFATHGCTFWQVASIRYKNMNLSLIVISDKDFAWKPFNFTYKFAKHCKVSRMCSVASINEWRSWRNKQVHAGYSYRNAKIRKVSVKGKNVQHGLKQSAVQPSGRVLSGNAVHQRCRRRRTWKVQLL